MTKSKPKRGRPLTGAQKRDRYPIWLQSSTAASVRKLGGGNLSQGVEKMHEMTVARARQ